MFSSRWLCRAGCSLLVLAAALSLPGEASGVEDPEAAAANAGGKRLAQHSVQAKVGSASVYDRRYSDLVKSYFDRAPGSAPVYNLGYSFIPDGERGHWGFTIDFSSMDNKEAETFGGGELSVSYDYSSITGGLIRYIFPEAEMMRRLVFGIGVKGGIASTRIKISSPTGDVNYKPRSELIAELDGLVLFYVWRGLHLDAEVEVGSRVNWLFGVGYGF